MTSVSNPQPRLFVGGLPYRYTEGELLNLFAPFGRVISLKIMHTPWGKSRGMGFVEFDNLESSIKAKESLHNHRIAEDRTIIVDYAQPDPFNTPEGQQKHLESVARQEAKHPRPQQPSAARPFKPKTNTVAKPIHKPVYGETRQSIYDSRTHHSRVGAKFSARNRSKKK